MTARVDLTRFGIAVGHATDQAGATGLTVIRGLDHPMRAGVAIFGRATGSRELHAASADHVLAGRVDAIMLTGGSAFGLDAAAGVMRWMEERGRGVRVGPRSIVPIVPAAVVFDLSPLGKPEARPTAAMAYDAAERATQSSIEEGSVGAGTGATIGKIGGSATAMKGGFGCAIEQTTNGEFAVAAFVVVNAFGDVRDQRGNILAGARAESGAFSDTLKVLESGAERAMPFVETAMQNTTLAVVVVNIPRSATELTQLARAAGAALFRRITPCGTSSDGDTIFALSPAQGEQSPIDPTVVESLAVTALERAIERAVQLARGRDGVPGLADRNGN